MTDTISIKHLRVAHEEQAKRAEGLREALAEAEAEAQRLREALETIERYSTSNHRASPRVEDAQQEPSKRRHVGIQATVHKLLSDAGQSGMARQAIIRGVRQHFGRPVDGRVVGSAIAQLRRKGKVRNGGRGHWFVVQGELRADSDELKM